MENNKKQKNTKKVVLNLTQEQAQKLNSICMDSRIYPDECKNFCKRLSKTILRNQVIETYREQYNAEPTTEQIERAMQEAINGN